MLPHEQEELAAIGRRRLAELCVTYTDTIQDAAWLIATVGESTEHEPARQGDGRTPQQRRQQRLKALAVAGMAEDGELRCQIIAEGLFKTLEQMEAFLEVWKSETGIARAEQTLREGEP